MKRRVHYLINKRMQLAWTFRFLFVIIVFALFVAFEMYITMWPVASGLIPEELINLARHQVLFRLICFSFPAILVIILFALIFTHRIAGPLYRLEKTLDKLLQGEDVKPIRLRKNDELKDLTIKINSLASMIINSKNHHQKEIPSQE